MEISLEGRSAIITGGSKGIGFATAERFLRSGAKVAILARGQAGLDDAMHALQSCGGDRLIAVKADVSSAGEVEQAFDAVRSAFRQVDIVVNNAGTVSAGPFEELTDEKLQADLDLKLFAAVRVTRLAWAGMKERRWGRVLNILSITAKTPGANTSPTSISRAAGMALTKILAGEGAPYNILVNALLVGNIESYQVSQHALKQGMSLEKYVAGIAERLPMQRVGQPRELADLACFLASDSGSYINGTAINVDGGESRAL